MLIKLASQQAEIFGRVCYWTFLEAGVEGLPEINGQPALTFQGVFKGPTGPNRLPRGYGSRFGQRAYGWLLKKFRNLELVEDVISQVAVKLAAKTLKIKEGSSLGEAENLILVSLKNAALNVIKKKKEVQLTNRDDEEDTSPITELADPSGFKRIEEIMSPQDWSRLLQNLEMVHERAPEWAQAQVDGVTNTELAAQWGVTPGYITNWLTKYRDNIALVFKKHLRDAA
jgi:DNA-directed RNA polymerase specialized sigma24 family protein